MWLLDNKIQHILHEQINIPAPLIKQYASLGMNEKHLAIILHIHAAQQKGNYFPTPEELAQHLTISSEECSTLLRQLIQRDLLAIEEDPENSRIKESYSLEPIWEKLFLPEEKKEEDQPIGELFQRFEREFGRPISPFEIEMINNWLDEDKYEISLIYAALREAVLMSKLNFKYIDRILLEWRKKGIRSSHEAQQTGRSFRSSPQISANRESRSNDKALYYNWLEE